MAPERPRLLIQLRPGGAVRRAARTEVCQHVWVRKSAWSGGLQHAYCIGCGATTRLPPDGDGRARS